MTFPVDWSLLATFLRPWTQQHAQCLPNFCRTSMPSMCSFTSPNIWGVGWGFTKALSLNGFSSWSCTTQLMPHPELQSGFNATHEGIALDCVCFSTVQWSLTAFSMMMTGGRQMRGSHQIHMPAIYSDSGTGRGSMRTRSLNMFKHQSILTPGTWAHGLVGLRVLQR